MQHDNATPSQIVVIRDRIAILTEYYNEPKNKGFIYSLSLTVFGILLLLALTIIPMTATSTYRIAFYLPLIIFTLLIVLSLHWLIRCAFEYFRVNGYTIPPQPSDDAQPNTFIIQ